MKDLRIGNWLVTADGIEWDGKIYNGYFINKDRLLEPHAQDDHIFDWLLHLAEKKWLTEEDVYALNTAMMYALERFKVRPGKLSFVKTLVLQQEILKEKVFSCLVVTVSGVSLVRGKGQLKR